MAMPFQLNAVLREEDPQDVKRSWRILWVPADQLDIVIIELGNPRALPVWRNRGELEHLWDHSRLEVLSTDPTAETILADMQLSESQIRGRDKRWKAIRDLVEDPERRVFFKSARGSLISSAAARALTSRNYIYDWLRLYWQLGQIKNALVPRFDRCGLRGEIRIPGDKKRGRPRYGNDDERCAGINITPDDRKNLRDGKRFRKRGLTWRAAYDETINLHWGYWTEENGKPVKKTLPADTIPTFEQFKYELRRVLAPGEVLRKVAGEATFAQKHRERLGTTLYAASGPGHIYEIDSTIADIYLKSRLNRSRLVGRPVLYIVIDHYSHMIVGFHVALSGPSWEGVMMALANAMTDKVAFCAEYRITIRKEDWPSAHVPREIVCDRERPYLGSSSTNAAASLEFLMSNNPPRRPDLKPLVEYSFDLINDEVIKWLPGTTHGRKPGEKWHPWDARHTIHTFVKIMIEFILKYNKSHLIEHWPPDYRTETGADPTPLGLWSYGCSNGEQPQWDPLRIKASLLPRAKARETDHGLRFQHGLHYRSLSGIDIRQGWYVRTDRRQWRQHDISYDSRDVSRIFLAPEPGKPLEPFELTGESRRYSGWTLEEVRDHHAIRRVGNRRNQDQRTRVKDHCRSRVREINRKAAVQCPATASPTSTSRPRSDPEQRRQDHREERRLHAWTGTPATDTPPDQTAPIEPEYLPAPNEVPRLRRIILGSESAAAEHSNDEP